MAWQFDNPWVLEDLDNAPIAPAFDGRNLWVVQNDGSVVVIEFWGPYADLDNDDSNARYQAQEFDYVNAGRQGPAVRIVGRLVPQAYSLFGENYFAYAPYAIKYYNGFIYYIWQASQNNQPSLPATSYIVTETPVDVLDPTGYSTFGWDRFVRTLNSVGPHTQVEISNGALFYCNPAPTTNGTTTADRQVIFRIPLMGGATTTTFLPGRKQLATRNLAAANDCVYVSAFNDLSVHKFSGVDGSFISTIEVNRDVERLFAYGNDVYAISSLKAKSDLGDIEIPTSMVSKIDDADDVEAAFGILQASDDGIVPSAAFDTAHTWFVNAAGGFQRTTNATELTLTSNDLGEVLASDMVFADTHKGILITGNDVETYDLVGLDGTVLEIFISPPTHYEWFNGTSFETIAVPSYLFLVTEDKLVCVMLPKALKFQNDFSINQYTAVSTGVNSYKGG